MRITLKAVNEELARRGHRVLLEKGDGYFYFRTGEAADWLDRTVQVYKVNDLSVDEWVARFEELQRKNRSVLTPPRPRKKKAAR